MDISQLQVTQSGLRDVDQLVAMVKWIRGGGKFNDSAIQEFCIQETLRYKSPIIQISRFPDDKHFIADGHHRTLAIKMAQRDFLYPDEYLVTDWVYEDYLEINFKNNWVTPFDPRVEFRLADFLVFKKAVRKRLEESEIIAREYILANSGLYKQTKTFESIGELADNIGIEI